MLYGNRTARLLAEKGRSCLAQGDGVAFKAEERKSYKCNQKGHLAHACKKLDAVNKGNDVKCFNCHKTSHVPRHCKKFCKIRKKINHTETVFLEK